MRPAILLLATAALAFSQGGAGFGRINSGAPGGRSVGGAGFGRTIFPGTGAPAAVRGPGGRGPLFIAPPAVHPAHARNAIVPFPVYYGGGYYPYDAPLAPEAADLPQDYAQGGYPQQAPVVIINQSFKPDVINPVLRDYSNTPLPQAVPQPGPQDDAAFQLNNDEPTIYLIAMNDRTIFATIAYWVDGETLNYVTREGSLNRASLALVDRDFSKELNDERHVEFKLPAQK
jgi:hypothetical protein